MAEWVLKGSLKGPQGDPGSDATVTVDSSLSADSENPVQNKVVKAALDEKLGLAKVGGVLSVITKDGAPLKSVVFYDSDTVGEALPETYALVGMLDADPYFKAVKGTQNIMASIGPGLANIQVGSTSNPEFVVSAGLSSAQVKFRGKAVTSITDAIPDSPAGNALVTDKAVADYVTANAPSVTLPLPVSQGGTGATTADGAAMMVFAHAPEASPTQAGVVKTLSDEDFCAYMGMEYDPADWS